MYEGVATTTPLPVRLRKYSSLSTTAPEKKSGTMSRPSSRSVPLSGDVPVSTSQRSSLRAMRRAFLIDHMPVTAPANSSDFTLTSKNEVDCTVVKSAGSL